MSSAYSTSETLPALAARCRPRDGGNILAPSVKAAMSGLAHADEGGEHAAATGPVVALMVLMELATPERAELRRIQRDFLLAADGTGYWWVYDEGSSLPE